MFTIFANILLCTFLYPLLKRIVFNKKIDFLEQILFTFGISVGFGSLAIFYFIFLFSGLISAQLMIFALLSIFILGLFLIRSEIHTFFLHIGSKFNSPKIDLEDFSIWKGVFWLLIGMFFLYVLVDSFFKPIFEWDSLARYVYWANRIFTLKQIDSIEVQYPLLLPLVLAYSFVISGGYQDYLAKLVPALFSIGTILATYLLAKKIFNEDIALIGSFLLTTTAIFFFWSTRVYVDIPQTFYTLLFLYSLYVYLTEKSLRYAVFAGIFLSIALWAKQSSTILYVTVLLLFILIWINKKLPIFDKKLSFSFRGVLTILILPPLLVGFWYIRNFLISGEFIWQGVKGADRSVETFFPFISQPSLFGEFISPIYFLGLFFGVISLLSIDFRKELFSRRWITLALFVLAGINVTVHHLKGIPLGLVSKYSTFIFIVLGVFCWLNKKIMIRLSLDWRLSFLFIFLIPYYSVIWWDYSWENRFWIVLSPFFAILAAFMIYRLIQNVNKYFEFRFFFSVLAVLLFMPYALQLIGHDAFHYGKVDDPFKKKIYIGEAYEYFIRVQQLNILTDKIVLTHDGRIGSFVPQVIFANLQPTSLTEIKKFDYFFVTPFTYYAYKTHSTIENEVIKNLKKEKFFEEIFSDDSKNYALYKVVK